MHFLPGDVLHRQDPLAEAMWASIGPGMTSPIA
jgi:hypothetical protein